MEKTGTGCGYGDNPSALADGDLDTLFDWESDPRAVHLAAFTRANPSDRSARPLYGRVAEHNVASAKVPARAGFVEVGTETSFARGVGAEVVARI